MSVSTYKSTQFPNPEKAAISLDYHTGETDKYRARRVPDISF
jgi:hypothetical protein